MVGREDVSMVEILESNLDVVMNILNALSFKIIKIDDFFVRFQYDARL